MAIATLILPLLIAAPETRITPMSVFSGAASKVTTAETRLISTQSDWNQAWARHRGSTTSVPPRVDFNRFRIVAVHLGAVDRCRGIIISPAPFGLYESSSEFILRFRPNWRFFGTRYEETTPFLFITVPRKAKPIRLVMDTTKEAGQKPVWEDYKTLRP